MRITYTLSLLICLATPACIQFPAYPKHIKIEKCKTIPINRLFNQSQFASAPGKSEIRIIRDVGNIGREGFVTVTIDSAKFTEMDIWETSSVFLTPGPHSIHIDWPSGVFNIGKKPKDTIILDLRDHQSELIRIDLGNSTEPIRIAKQ